MAIRHIRFHLSLTDNVPHRCVHRIKNLKKKSLIHKHAMFDWIIKLIHRKKKYNVECHSKRNRM